MDQCRTLSAKNCLFRIFNIILIITGFSICFMKTKSSVQTGCYMRNASSAVKSLNEPNVRCIVYFKDRPGRLGNHMFIIASTYGLARLHSCHMYLTIEMVTLMKSMFIFDLSPFLISSARFDSITRNPSKPMKNLTKDIVCQYIPELTRPNAIASGDLFELKGYWQSYLHFEKYGDDIRKFIFAPKQSILEKVSKLFVDVYRSKFDFKPEFSLDNHQLFKKRLTESNWTTWIGIHVRRSDFISLDFASSDEYLFSAIEYFTDRYPNAHFIVASDDKRYCKNLFRKRGNIFITPNTFSVSDDLITLSLCEHSIITGGTFGWWTGYLANGQVVHDKMYASGCERREYYYPPWFLIDGKVRAHKSSNYTL